MWLLSTLALAATPLAVQGALTDAERGLGQIEALGDLREGPFLLDDEPNGTRLERVVDSRRSRRCFDISVDISSLHIGKVSTKSGQLHVPPALISGTLGDIV